MRIAICDNEQTELEGLLEYTYEFSDRHMFSASIDRFERGEDEMNHDAVQLSKRRKKQGSSFLEKPCFFAPYRAILRH